MLSQERLARLLGRNDYFFAQYFAYGFTGRLQSWIFRSRIEMLLDYIARIRFRPRMILDVGCGPMFISNDLMRNGDGQYIGADILSRFKLKKYRDAMREVTGKTIEAVRASGELLPFQCKAFDLVLTLDMLEHLEKPKQCAAEIRRTAKRNGLIVVTLPLENLFQRLFRINFILMKIAGDRNVKRVKLNMVARWMIDTPPYHYSSNIKSYDAMIKMLGGLFTSLHVDYTPLGYSKSINVNGVLFFLKKTFVHDANS